MREYARRIFTSLALLAGAAVLWYLGRRLLDLTGALMDVVGPIWALIIYGVVTVALAAVWIRYGGAGALGRWGVTIRPAEPLDPLPGESEEGVPRDLPDIASRRGDDR